MAIFVEAPDLADDPVGLIAVGGGSDEAEQPPVRVFRESSLGIRCVLLSMTAFAAFRIVGVER
ncbi:MAG: hypothetical protein J6Y80_05250 [Victivallales bacterium]|nr:hypothetical protein [Victivallales bacterium]